MFWTAERREILCSRGVPSLVNRKLLTAQRAERTADGLVVQSVFQRGERAYSKSWLEWVGNLGERWKVFHVHRMGWFLPEIPLLFGLLWTVSQRCFWQPFGNCGGINRIIQSVMKGKRIGNSAIVHCSPQGDLLFWDPQQVSESKLQIISLLKKGNREVQKLTILPEDTEIIFAPGGECGLIPAPIQKSGQSIWKGE